MATSFLSLQEEDMAILQGLQQAELGPMVEDPQKPDFILKRPLTLGASIAPGTRDRMPDALM